MRNSTILFASALMLGAVTANAQAQTVHKRVKSSFKATEGSSVLMAQDSNPRTFKYQNRKYRTAESVSKFKPEKEIAYTYTEDGTWEIEAEYAYTYKTYDDGSIFNTQTQTSDDEVLLTETSVSNDGLTRTIVEKTSEDGGKTFVNSSKAVFTYDPIVSDLVVKKQRYVWNEETEAWTEITDSFIREIVRDADNNITSLMIKVPYQGEYDPIERYTNTVDQETKQIVSYKYERLGYDANAKPVWNTEQYLTDIKWKETNGQIVSQYDEWRLWGNNLLSATLAYEEDGETKSFGDINVTYVDDGGYTEQFNYTDKLERTTVQKNMLDANGSFCIEEKTIEDLDEDGTLTDSEVTGWTKEEVSYDDRKNLVLDDGYEFNIDTNELEHVMGEKVDYVYDDEHSGEPKETLSSSYDMDADEYVPYSKVVVTKFIDTASGINEVKNTSKDNTTTIYNILGVALNRSALNGNGLFIVKKDGKTIKVLK